MIWRMIWRTPLAGWALLVALALGGCASTMRPHISKAELAAARAHMERDIAVLASDDFGGRKPGTQGESKALAYIRGELEAAGYQSGTNDPAHDWLAPVPLARIMPVSTRIALKALHKKPVEIAPQDVFTLLDKRRVLIEGDEMVFVGRGEVGLDAPQLRGKVALMLSGSRSSAARRKALAEAGAAAVIVVIEEDARFDRFKRRSARERLVRAEQKGDLLALFVRRDAIARAIGEVRWEKILAAADAQDFAPMPLKLRATIEAVGKKTLFNSYNLIARHPGTERDAGAVLMLAHWDHFGICGEEGDADRICNGAVDNASGVAMMLELARRLASAGPHRRDIYVLATTAEESGLLGARAFVEDPPIPLDNFVAAFNFDTVALAPSGTPVGYIGEGQGALDTSVDRAIKALGRTKGSAALAGQYRRRQDGWVLQENGVPSLLLSSTFGDKELLEAFIAERYHTARDNPDNLEFGGALEDLELNEMLLRQFAQTGAGR